MRSVLRGLTIYSLTIALVAAPTPARALLNFANYRDLAALEADLDRSVHQLQQRIKAKPYGDLDSIGLTHLRNLVQARHSDFFYFQLTGSPFRKDKADFFRQLDAIVSKHDQRLLRIFETNYVRFDDRDRDDVDAMQRTITAEFNGLIQRVPPPGPPGAAGYAERAGEYLWFQAQEALYQRDFDRARRLLERADAAELIPRPVDRWMALGAVYLFQEEYARAGHAYEQAFPGLCESSCGAFVHRRHDVANLIIWIYGDRLAEYDKARKYYEYRYERERENPDLLNAYAYFLLEKLNDPAAARPLTEAALALRPDSPHILDTYGYLLYQEGKPAEAAQYYRRALQLGGLTPEEVEIVTGHLREVEGAGISDQ